VAHASHAYSAGRPHSAWAGATIADAAAGSWTRDRLRRWALPRRGEGVLDIRARALAMLSFIEADEGHVESAAGLRRTADDIVSKLTDPTAARLDIGTTEAERSIRLGHAGDAVSLIEDLLRMPSMTEAQRAAAQVALAGALRHAARMDEALATLKSSAESFTRAGMPAAKLEVDLERGTHMLRSGDSDGARSLLMQVAEATATSGHAAVELEARIQLGVIASEAGQHPESAEQFQLGAAAARRAGNDLRIVVALRNAADELRLQGDLMGAEKLFDEVFKVPVTSPNLALDQSKAKLLLAILRHRQNRRDEAAALLDDAAAAFQARLGQLAAGESPLLREDLVKQLAQVADLRTRMQL
jgi:tetratricopeptide (TPR) repeat protein